MDWGDDVDPPSQDDGNWPTQHDDGQNPIPEIGNMDLGTDDSQSSSNHFAGSGNLPPPQYTQDAEHPSHAPPQFLVDEAPDVKATDEFGEDSGFLGPNFIPKPRPVAGHNSDSDALDVMYEDPDEMETDLDQSYMLSDPGDGSGHILTKGQFDSSQSNVSLSGLPAW